MVSNRVVSRKGIHPLISEQEQGHKSTRFRRHGAFRIYKRTPVQLTMQAFAAVLVLLSVAVIGSEAADRCHLRELDLCAATYATSNRIATSESDVDKQCNLIQEVSECFNNFTKLCTTPIQRELVALVTEGARDAQKKFCTRGEKVRSEYLKPASCLAKAQPQGRICIDDVKSGLQAIEEAKFSDRISTACCVYTRYADCATKTVESQCGAEAVEYGNLVIRMVSSNLFDITCQAFKNNPQCDTLLPPSGTKAKSSGKGVISKLFSAYYS